MWCSCLGEFDRRRCFTRRLLHFDHSPLSSLHCAPQPRIAGDILIEATSGNTGIALAMAAAIKGYKLKLIMPSNMTEERKASMAAYGAELIEVGPGQMEAARGERHLVDARSRRVSGSGWECMEAALPTLTITHTWHALR